MERLLTVVPPAEHGLWERNGEGWVIHDWLDHNLSKQQAKELAEKKRVAGKLGGKAKAKR